MNKKNWNPKIPFTRISESKVIIVINVKRIISFRFGIVSQFSFLLNWQHMSLINVLFSLITTRPEIMDVGLSQHLSIEKKKEKWKNIDRKKKTGKKKKRENKRKMKEIFEVKANCKWKIAFCSNFCHFFSWFLVSFFSYFVKIIGNFLIFFPFFIHSIRMQNSVYVTKYQQLVPLWERLLAKLRYF